MPVSCSLSFSCYHCFKIISFLLFIRLLVFIILSPSLLLYHNISRISFSFFLCLYLPFPTSIYLNFCIRLSISISLSISYILPVSLFSVFFSLTLFFCLSVFSAKNFKFEQKIINCFLQKIIIPLPKLMQLARQATIKLGSST